jgi:hypothetical protein
MQAAMHVADGIDQRRPLGGRKARPGSWNDGVGLAEQAG